jgi:fumarate hydratase, class II
MNMQTSGKDILYGANTRDAINNFAISELKMPRAFIHALGLLKSCCAYSNSELKLLDENIAGSIQTAAMAVAQGQFDEQFVVDVFQTGSGTSTNMNINEVIATLASKELSQQVHPNNHVNMGQSSNDVIPSCIHISAVITVNEQLLPALQALAAEIEAKSLLYKDSIKTARTHLMDAMPMTFGQELGGWAAQIRSNIERLKATLPRLTQLAIGGTAVGTGVNSQRKFAPLVVEQLTKLSGHTFVTHHNYFEALSCQDTAVELSGCLNTLAVSLMKICNDIRWMNSGPLNGLAEITLPKLQAGSSIMPGKVNPVIAEAVTMACAQVMGNHTTITIAGQSGNFQLNTMLPIIAYNVLQSIHLMATSATSLSNKVIKDMQVNVQKTAQAASYNPILVTALNSTIGYDLGSKIAQQAYEQKRPILDIAQEMTDLSEAQLRELLDIKQMLGPKD